MKEVRGPHLNQVRTARCWLCFKAWQLWWGHSFTTWQLWGGHSEKPTLMWFWFHKLLTFHDFQCQVIFVGGLVGKKHLVKNICKNENTGIFTSFWSRFGFAPGALTKESHRRFFFWWNWAPWVQGTQQVLSHCATSNPGGVEKTVVKSTKFTKWCLNECHCALIYIYACECSINFMCNTALFSCLLTGTYIHYWVGSWQGTGLPAHTLHPTATHVQNLCSRSRWPQERLETGHKEGVAA